MNQVFQKEIEKYEVLIEQNPTRLNSLKLADLYLRNGQKLLAYPIIIKILENKSNDIQGIILLAIYYYDREEYQKSFQLLKPNIEYNKLNLKLLNLYFSICEQLNKSEDLAKCCRYILFIDSNDEKSLTYLSSEKKVVDQNNHDDWQVFDTSNLMNKNLFNLYEKYGVNNNIALTNIDSVSRRNINRKISFLRKVQSKLW